jgi:Domain of unknown function (DUF4177)
MNEQDSAKPIWEYKVLRLGPSTANSAESVLDTMGNDGWELVTFQPNGDRAYPGEGMYILKRVKEILKRISADF